MHFYNQQLLLFTSILVALYKKLTVQMTLQMYQDMPQVASFANVMFKIMIRSG